jgi:tRNA/rRNA methyltransferase
MNISFILVEPAVPENVGAAARAIKTMGFTDLRLVNPCNHLDMKAKMLAHASHDILENAKIYPILSEAIADLDFVIATSAKQRWVKLDIIPSNQIHKFLEEKENSISRIGIVFGREESGSTEYPQYL